MAPGKEILPTLLYLSNKEREYHMVYISVEDYAKKHNKSVEVVKAYLNQGRIPYARRRNAEWQVPSDAPWPQPKPASKINHSEQT